MWLWLVRCRFEEDTEEEVEPDEVGGRRVLLRELSYLEEEEVDVVFVVAVFVNVLDADDLEVGGGGSGGAGRGSSGCEDVQWWLCW